MSADDKSMTKNTQHAKVFAVWSVSACTNILLQRSKSLTAGYYHACRLLALAFFFLQN